MMKKYVIMLSGLIWIWTAACTKMDYHYRDFLPMANRIYVGKVDSVKVHPGKNRIKFSWKKSPDPTVTHVTAYWNNKRDSLTIPISDDAIDTAELIIPNLDEETYVFELFASDAVGNRSVPVEVVGKVYGAQYESLLLNRLPRSAQVQGDSLVVAWFEAGGDGLLGTTISYRNQAGANQAKTLHPDSIRSVLYDVDYAEEISYRSAYFPDTLAVDTFYTRIDWITLN